MKTKEEIKKRRQRYLISISEVRDDDFEVMAHDVKEAKKIAQKKIDTDDGLWGMQIDAIGKFITNKDGVRRYKTCRI